MLAHEPRRPFLRTAAKRPERNSRNKPRLGCRRRLGAESSKYRMAYYIFGSLRHATCPRDAFERSCRRAIRALGSGESRGRSLAASDSKPNGRQAGGGSPAPLEACKHAGRTH